MRKILVAAIIYSLFFIHFSNSSAHAQSGLSLGVFPPILEITANPPAQVESRLVVQNLGDETKTLEINLKPFRPSTSRDGQIEFLPEGQLNGPDPLILQKVRIFDGDEEIKTIELAPFESKELTVNIDIEKSAPLGDYYFSIVFINDSATFSDSSSTAATGGIGVNVILGIGQKGDTKGQIIDFSAPLINSSGPIPITLLLRNDSEHYITPRGTVLIRNMFGQEVGRLPILPQYILSNSERYMRDENQASASAELTEAINKLNSKNPVLVWPEEFLFGIYTAEAHVRLSDDSPLFATTIHFYAAPLYLMAAISFFTFILLGIYIRVKRKI